MLFLKSRKTSLTYLMAVTMSTTPAFHVGDTIQIETLLNGRNDKNFLSDQQSIDRYVVTQLPKGTLGEVEQIQQFKPAKGKSKGNTGLYIKIKSGPNAGKKYWVLYRPDKNFVKLYDKNTQETTSPPKARTAVAQHSTPALEDRRPAQVSPSDAAQQAHDVALMLKWAGVLPEYRCHSAQTDPTQQARDNAQLSSDVIELKQAIVPDSTSSNVSVTENEHENNNSQRKTLTSSVDPIVPEHEQLSTAEDPGPPIGGDPSRFLGDTTKVQSNDPELALKAQAITRGITNERERAMKIHDWVVNNVYYDTESYNKEYVSNIPFTRNFDALDVFRQSPQRTAVCGGYATLTTALLRASKIPARIVYGFIYDPNKPNVSGSRHTPEECMKAKAAPEHHWVEAYVNGRWLPMDTTWDAGYVIFDQNDPAARKKIQSFVWRPSDRYMDRDLFNLTHERCGVDDYY
jgi:hypothetical protein